MQQEAKESLQLVARIMREQAAKLSPHDEIARWFEEQAGEISACVSRQAEESSGESWPAPSG
jgi:hypothetical protein